MPTTKATYITVPTIIGGAPAGRSVEKPASAPTKLSRRHRQAIKTTDRFDDKIRHPWEVKILILSYGLGLIHNARKGTL